MLRRRRWLRVKRACGQGTSLRCYHRHMESRNGNGLGPPAAAMIIKAAMIGLLVAPSLLALARGGLADEPPHLEFARRLRVQGMPDLALEYLEKLRKKAACGTRGPPPRRDKRNSARHGPRGCTRSRARCVVHSIAPRPQPIPPARSHTNPRHRGRISARSSRCDRCRRSSEPRVGRSRLPGGERSKPGPVPCSKPPPADCRKCAAAPRLWTRQARRPPAPTHSQCYAARRNSSWDSPCSGR